MSYGSYIYPKIFNNAVNCVIYQTFNQCLYSHFLTFRPTFLLIHYFLLFFKILLEHFAELRQYAHICIFNKFHLHQLILWFFFNQLIYLILYPSSNIRSRFYRLLFTINHKALTNNGYREVKGLLRRYFYLKLKNYKYFLIFMYFLKIFDFETLILFITTPLICQLKFRLIIPIFDFLPGKLFSIY